MTTARGVVACDESEQNDDAKHKSDAHGVSVLVIDGRCPGSVGVTAARPGNRLSSEPDNIEVL
jgi:hypothetical protein